MEVFRIHEEVAVYYLTFSIVHWLPVFVAEAPCRLFVDSLNFCHQHKSLRINAFVIMPTHVHLILFDAQLSSARLRQTVTDLRKYSGRRLSAHCEQKGPAVFAQVMSGSRRTDRHKQFWQQSRHPVAIGSGKSWKTKIDYLHDNPRRKGLVRAASHWRFSSAAYWLSEPAGESDVILSGLLWE